MGTVFNRHPYLILIFICLFTYILSPFHLPVTDRDEGRFVQATKQMLETGDYLTIKFQDEFRNKKPAGIYWLQAVSVKLCQQPLNQVWPYRLPSLLSAIFCVLLTFYFATRLFNPDIARYASLFMASSTVLIVEATTAKTDSTLLLTTLISVGFLGLGYMDQTKRLSRSVLLGLSLAAGMMIKGPLVIFFFLSTLLGLFLFDKQRVRNFHWPLIIAIPLLVVIPWFVMIQKVTGGQFAHDSLGHDFSQKILSAQEGHGAPPGFFTISLFIGLWSSTLWLFPALKEAWNVRHTSRALKFCLAAIGPAFLVLELIPTKLIHYPLPLYPWLAMVTAWGFHTLTSQDSTSWMRWVRYFWLLISLIISNVFWIITLYVGGDLQALIIALVLGNFLFASAILSFKRSTPYTVIGACLILPLALSFWLPRLTPIWVTEKIYDKLANDTSSAPILLMGYGEPSAPFRLGTTIQMSKKLKTLTTFLESDHGHIFIDERLIQGDVEKLLKNTHKLHFVDEITGINYNKMKHLSLKHYVLEVK